MLAEGAGAPRGPRADAGSWWSWTARLCEESLRTFLERLSACSLKGSTFEVVR